MILAVIASFLLLFLGVLGLLFRRNTLIVFLSVEMMLNGANLLFVVFAREWGNQTGLVWVFFVLVVAAAEAAVGLALLVELFRKKQTVDIDQYSLLKG